MFKTRKESSREIGNFTEKLALDFLTKKGLICVERNFTSRLGEIDLIMRDKAVLVFVEVRFRRGTEYGTGIETVNYSKQKRIIRTAQYYLLKHNLTNELNCRFDVISISMEQSQYKINWIENAFDGF